jgi:mono/diheme cytochrome c family protein
MKISLTFWTSLLCLMLLGGCYYDNEEDLYLGSSGCDTTHVSYSTTLAPIFSANCNSCHSGGAPSGNLTTDTYESVKLNISRIRGAVNHESGYSPMPQNGNQLDACERSKIQAWINQGMQNN